MKINLLTLGSFVLMAFSSAAQLWDHAAPALLNGSANSAEAEESIPVFSGDSSTLYFVRSNYTENTGGANDYDIWYSKKNEKGEYTESKSLKELNNKLNNSVVGISKNGQSMYVLNSYEGKKDQVKGIAVVTKSNDAWSKPKAIDIPTLDIDGEFYGFHVSENEKTIIISYAGTGTLGQEDLYVSTKNGTNWSEPVHMGSKINSSGFEISPFLSPNQDTLFFSSNGFGGQGDADIFYSIKQGGWADWSTPINLGSDINSSGFDAYFSHNGKQAFWSSNRSGGLSDIYTIDFRSPEPIELSCIGKDVSVFGGKDGSVNASVLGGVAPYTFSWSNGGTKQDLNGLSKGAYSLTVTDAKGQTATSSCTVNEPKAVVVTFKNPEFVHYFDYNKNKLSTEEGKLKAFVDEVNKQMAEGRKKITIEIYSSASEVPTQTFESNEKLAELRAKNVKALLEKSFNDRGIVEIVIVESGVNGPAYVNDGSDVKKYEEHQYIKLRTK